MGWAEKRIERYRQGHDASWVERRALEHANPVHLGLAVLSVIPLVCGLWLHNWLLRAVGILLSFFGHLWCWLQK